MRGLNPRVNKAIDLESDHRASNSGILQTENSPFFFLGGIAHSAGASIRGGFEWWGRGIFLDDYSTTYRLETDLRLITHVDIVPLLPLSLPGQF